MSTSTHAGMYLLIGFCQMTIPLYPNMVLVHNDPQQSLFAAAENFLKHMYSSYNVHSDRFLLVVKQSAELLVHLAMTKALVYTALRLTIWSITSKMIIYVTLLYNYIVFPPFQHTLTKLEHPMPSQ